MEWICKSPQRCLGSIKGVDVYATDRQRDAEAIVRILHETTERMYYDEGLCLLCLEREDNGHKESCPFQMADEFINKYGTHPPSEPRRA